MLTTSEKHTKNTIPSPLAQFGAVVRYEFKMHWRARGILISAITITLITLFVMSQISASSLKDTQAFSEFSEADKINGSTLLLASFGQMIVTTSMLILPILVADSIPKDKQFRVRELLDTLPLPDTIYLLGKVGGALAIVFLGLCIPLVVLGVGWWFAVYPYNLNTYLGMSLIVVMPMALLNAGLSVLLAATQPSRRRAILLGVGLAIALVVLMGLGLTVHASWIDIFNPGKPLLFKYLVVAITSSWGAPGDFAPITQAQLFLTLIVGSLELVAVGFVMRWVASRQAG